MDAGLKQILARKLATACRLYLNYYRGFSYDFLKNGEHDLLRKLGALPFRTVFDVGSNVGDWALTARKFFPAATIHAFELAQGTFQTLSGRLGSGNFVLNNVGLSDRTGMIRYKDYGPGSGLNTVVLSATFHDQTTAPTLLEAQTMTGDAYCAAAGIASIDFLKVDVEGAEGLVLRGFDGMLRRGAVRVVQFEYGYESGDAGTLMRHFYGLFEAHGYLVGRVRKGPITFPAWTYQNNDFDSGPNYLAVRRDDAGILGLLAR